MDSVYDIAIIGGGPTAFSAGLYSARARMKTCIIESPSIMGQLPMTDSVENYPGIKNIGGIEMVEIMKEQAIGFGSEHISGTVQKVSEEKKDALPVWKVTYDDKFIYAYSIIAASGAHPRTLNVPGEREFMAKGVSYCATCDGAFFKDKNIAVVGGGDSAVEEGIFLTRFGKMVEVFHRRDRLRAAKIIQERAFSNPKMSFVWDTVVEEINGKNKVESLKVKNIKTGQLSQVQADGIFIFIGWIANVDYLGDLVKYDDTGRILVDDEMRTSRPGIFAGGDCCKRPFHQAVTAAGDGAVASYSAELYVENLKG